MIAPPRYSLWAVAAVPLFYFAGLIAGGLAFPGFDHLAQLPSELGAARAPHPWIFNGAMALAGTAFLVGAVGLGRAVRALGGRTGPAAASGVLAVGSGAYLLAIAMFPLPDLRHYSVGPLALSIHPLPFVLAGALWSRPDWRRPRAFLLAIGVLMLAVLAVNVGVRPQLAGARPGLWPRLYAVAAFSWLAIVAVALYRRLPRARH